MIHERLGEIIGEWDASAVKAFHKKRPHYTIEHIITIARECGVAAVPFCGVCLDWHEPTEEHSGEESASS